jgi:curved DNA-binding protein CbpA
MSHYQLLGIESGADAEAIKKAFRREIARYHPDKVVHLGSEFQQLASIKAAELTKAYTTLSNPELRAAYDATLAGATPTAVPDVAAAASSRPVASPAPPPAPDAPRHDAPDPRGDIVRRAALGRLRAALHLAMPESTFASVSGFDLACLSRGKSSLFRRATPPSVLVRLAASVDKELVHDAYSCAMKAKLEQKPLVLLLAGDRLAPTSELSQAIEEQRRRSPAFTEVLIPVPVDIRDFSAKIPANAPAAVKTLIDDLKAYKG